MKWPFISRARYERELAIVVENADKAIKMEFDRAMREGKAMVHRFMVDATHNVFTHPRPEAAARAVFQQADREFGPAPVTLSAVLYSPANVKEAVDRA